MLAIFAVLAVSCGAEGAAPERSVTTEAVRSDPSEEPVELDIAGGGGSSTTLLPGEPALLDEVTTTPLSAGAYRTGVFEPAFTFEAPDGLHLLIQVPYGLGLAPEPTATMDVDAEVFSISRLEDVEVPEPVIRAPGEQKEKLWEPVPEDLVGWLTGVESLQATTPRPVNIGGLDGMAFDFAVDLPDDLKPCTPIGVPCVILFRHTPTGVSTFFPDNKIGRMWVLESDSEPLIIVGETQPGPNAEEWLETVEEIVDTIDFG